MEVIRKNTVTRYALGEIMGPVSRSPNLFGAIEKRWLEPLGVLENRIAAETRVSDQISSG